MGIPVLDLEGIDKDRTQHSKVAERVRDACAKWGFFQVVNHGIQASVLEEMIDGVRKFLEQDSEACEILDLSSMLKMEQFATWSTVSAPRDKQEEINFDASQYEFFGKNVAELDLEELDESTDDAPADAAGTELNRISRPRRLGDATERVSAPMETKFVIAPPKHSRQTGTVKWFSNRRGYGFIAPSGGGKDVFVHCSSLKSDGCIHLKPNAFVEYEIIGGPEGKTQAINVTAPGGRLLQDSRKLGPGQASIGGSSTSNNRSLSFFSSNTISFINHPRPQINGSWNLQFRVALAKAGN
ncbi:unnamed protein product [Dovyalis caffra]|uniref:CSD domain-containing protein n=1 Tax=Dovyalis caffra TaxID=77055 RepID=A0AAV1STK7_9ROSI|nr:unnamed protein product [Dovyalis caffra]